MVHTLLTEQLICLKDLLQQMDNSSYTKKSAMLSDSSIGQHVRHILEMIQCLLSGYERGIVNYDERRRDKQIENDLAFTISLVAGCMAAIENADKALSLKTHDFPGTVTTTYSRELLYNTEHAIHHMALIKVALRERGINITPENFGVAPATTRFKESQACAQ